MKKNEKGKEPREKGRVEGRDKRKGMKGRRKEMEHRGRREGVGREREREADRENNTIRYNCQLCLHVPKQLHDI